MHYFLTKIQLLLGLFICLLFSKQLHGQSTNADSLWNVWEDQNLADTTRSKALKQFVYKHYIFSQPDSAIYFARIRLQFTRDKKLTKDKADVYNTLGIAYAVKGDYPTSLQKFNQSLKMMRKINDALGIGTALGNIGNIYKYQGDYGTAIEYQTQSLKIKEDRGDSIGVASSLNNIGILNDLEENYALALNNYERALKIYDNVDDKDGAATTFTNLAFVHHELGNLELAIDYNMRSLKQKVAVDNQIGIAATYNNLGLIYLDMGEIEEAIHYYEMSLKIKLEIGGKEGIAISYNSLGSAYLKKGEPKIAIVNALKGLEIAKEIGVKAEVMLASEVLYKSYKILGKTAQALEMHEAYNETQSEIYTIKNQGAVLREQLKYDYSKKNFADSVRTVQRDTEHLQELERKAEERFYLYLGIGFLVLVVGISLNSYRQKRRAHSEISEQKNLVDLKNEEITASITYAKRIQDAFLPPDRLIKELLPQSFIYYNPKDIVAGDFYWIEKVGETIFFTAADCTGHGVPGAMISVICHNAINRSVHEFGLRDPGLILDKVRELVGQAFEQSEENVRDGMDIALCALTNKELKYAGANNPLWIVRDGAILETKATKQAIGKVESPKPFQSHSFEVQANDSIYIFSDGFVDQFGGERGKKFKPKALRELLLSVQNQDMALQGETFSNTFEAWRGDHEQVDDVCVFGVKI